MGVKQITEDRLLNTKQLSIMLAISTGPLEKDRINGTGKFPPWLKIGKSCRYRLSDVHAWLDKQTRRNHTSEAA